MAVPGYWTGKTVTIDDSYVAANVQSADAVSGFVGGLVFNATDAAIVIRRTYFSGNALGNNVKSCIVNNANPTGGRTVADVYYDSSVCTQSQTSSGAIAGVTGLTTAALQTATPFTNWSTSNWTFANGVNPKLIWEP